MKKRKNSRLFLWALVICLLLSFSTGCNGEKEGNTPTAKPTAVPQKSTPTATLATATPSADIGAPTPTTVKTPEPSYEQGSELYAGGISSEDVFFCETSEQLINKAFVPIEYDDGRLGVQFFATTAFNSVAITLPTWSQTSGFSATLELYTWQQSYTDTLEGKPLYTQTFQDWNEASWDVKMTFDQPLLDGEYLLYIRTAHTTAHERIGTWYSVIEGNDIMRCYLNDEEWYDAAVLFAIEYNKTPQNFYGPLSDSGF